MRIAATLAGVVAGAALTLSLPAPGGPPPAPQPRPLGPIPVRTLLAWTPGQLPPGFADTVRNLPGIAAVAEVRSGTVWVSEFADGAGRATNVPGGYAVPVETAAVDPGTYLPFVAPADRPVFASLARGVGLLGRTAASLRAMTSGTLDARGVELEVEGVVADEAIGAHELVVSQATGERLGVVRGRYVLVAPRRDEHVPTIERRIRDAAPGRIRVRGPHETPVFRHGDAVLPPVRLKELFGEFAAVPAGAEIRIDPAWIASRMRSRPIPVLGAVRCHEAILAQLGAAFDEIARRGLAGLVDPDDFGGCLSPRFLNGDPHAGLSHHAWGVAFDLNVSQNPFGAQPSMDARVVEVLERWGFTWGGRWLIPDGMHFEFVRFPLSPKG